jgi:hypothetical protein
MKGEWAALDNSYLRLQGNLVKNFGNGGQIRSYQIGSGSPSTAGQYAAKDMLNLGGSAPLLFSAGTGGTLYGDVGLIRGDGSTASALNPGNDQTRFSKNVLALIGTLGRLTKTAADTAGDDLHLQGGLGTGTGGGGGVRFRTQSPTTSGTGVPDSTDRVVINQAGVTSLYKGADVASASTITPTGNSFHVTGATTVTAISTTGLTAGTTLTLIFDASCTVQSGALLMLQGGVNFSATADDVLVLYYDGSKFREVTRSVN